jgi:hypothetical protein
MPQFQGLPRAVLVAISTLSGDQYREVDGKELRAELARNGYDPDSVGLYNLMFRLRDDGGYVEFHGAGFGDIEACDLIRLGEAGRQEVEGWPRSGEMAGADVEALLQAFEERANDQDSPEAERDKASRAATALRDVGVEVTGNVIASWLRALGIG